MTHAAAGVEWHARDGRRVVFALAIVVWEGSISAFHIQQFLLPRPSDIAIDVLDRAATSSGRPAGTRSRRRSAASSSAPRSGSPCATLVARFEALGTALMPVAIAASAIPIIAFAPIFNAWFNPLSPTSKMAIAGVLCFLPVLVNTLRGLQSASPRQIELMRSYAASEREIWRRVRVPTALPYLFTALKVASVLAMIGAVVGEYFGGAFNALGVLIRSDAQIFDFQRGLGGNPRRVAARTFALLLPSYSLERLVVRWAPENRGS